MNMFIPYHERGPMNTGSLSMVDRGFGSGDGGKVISSNAMGDWVRYFIGNKDFDYVSGDNGPVIKPIYEVRFVMNEAQDGTSIAGGFVSLLGESFEFGKEYNPKYAQSAETIALKTAEALKMGKYAKYASRTGNTLTGLSIGLSIGDYVSSDKSWGDQTKLGVNLGIAGLGVSRNGYAISASIILGIAETAGAFNGMYERMDLAQRTGILILSMGPYPTIISLH